MTTLDAIKAAEKAVEDAKANLAGAVENTFVEGTKVLVKGPQGDKETEVVSASGEDVLVKTSKGTMKRHYSTLRLA
jgi:hypothetical protein